MATTDESARSRIQASLGGDLGRALTRSRARAWTVGEILGAAEALRRPFSEGQGLLGLALAQPGHVLAALLAAWGEGRRPLLLDPGLKREAEVLRRQFPNIRIYAEAGASGEDRVVLGEILSASRPVARHPEWLRLPKDDEPFVALLTSASTGENKVVDKLGFQLYRQAEALATMVPLAPQGRVLSFVPPCHMLGFFYGLVLPLARGAESVVATDLAGGMMMELLAKYHPDLVVGTATHYRFLARAAAGAKAPASPTAFLSSGAPLDPSVAEAFSRSFGTSVRELYGSTELGGVAFRAWPNPYRTMPGVRFRIDPDSGHLEVMSPWAGGARGVWVATDDAAEPASDTGFHLLGRIDHVVKVGGKRFSTVEVEQALRSMPAVTEAAVFPYLRFGEPAIAAAMALEPSATLDVAAVRVFLAERLASYKLPRSILMLPALPRASHDKVDYRALHDLVAEGRSREAEKVD